METVSFALDGDESGPVVLVEMEVEEDTGGDALERVGLTDWISRRAKISFDEALSSIPRVAKAVKEQVDTMEHPPDCVELSVGLKFSGSTSVKIVSSSAESHLNLTMKWDNGK